MTTNLTTKREEINNKHVGEKIASILKHDSLCTVLTSGVCNCHFYAVANQLSELYKIEFDQALQSYGEEVAKQTREEVIEEIQKHVHEQAIESQTDVNIEFDLYLDQLRSTQPKEEGNIQRLPDTLIKGKHTGSTVAVKTFNIKLTDKDKP